MLQRKFSLDSPSSLLFRVVVLGTEMVSLFSLFRVGCILLSVGQNKFHTEALHTLKYVVNQSDYTVGILQNVTQYLSLAKTINVTRFSLPPNVLGEIDKLNVNLNNAAITLQETTTDNAAKIKRVFYAV